MLFPIHQKNEQIKNPILKNVPLLQRCRHRHNLNYATRINPRRNYTIRRKATLNYPSITLYNPCTHTHTHPRRIKHERAPFYAIAAAISDFCTSLDSSHGRSTDRQRITFALRNSCQIDTGRVGGI